MKLKTSSLFASTVLCLLDLQTHTVQGFSLSSARHSLLLKSPRDPQKSVTARMCGLIAVVEDVWDDASNNNDDKGTPHELLQESILDEATQILNHRGPDGHQTFVDRQFAMGHTRLAIVDPDNRQADMPFSLDYTDTESNTKIHLVANGEIYNHRDVYRQLETEASWDPSHRISNSDCEVIGHAYQTLGGPATAKLLDGMFAFVVVEQDATTGEIRNVFAARDPVGIKPLYIGNKNGSYVFSSELKALVGHVDPSSVVAVPAGHYWSPASGLERFYQPEWLMDVSTENYLQPVFSNIFAHL